MISGLIKCEECEKRFKSKYDLMAHKELEHDFDLTCEYCDFKCTELTQMLNHNGSKHGQKCEQWDCHFNYNGSKYNPNEFKVMKVHGFKCTECEDGFENKEQLKEHKLAEHIEIEESVN